MLTLHALENLRYNSASNLLGIDSRGSGKFSLPSTIELHSTTVCQRCFWLFLKIALHGHKCLYFCGQASCWICQRHCLRTRTDRHDRSQQTTNVRALRPTPPSFTCSPQPHHQNIASSWPVNCIGGTHKASCSATTSGAAHRPIVPIAPKFNQSLK